ncbi:MAG: HD domain-containing protein [Bacteroidales bacterium]|nr:HD domain-containing protein [Bacteroidales bacterium]
METIEINEEYKAKLYNWFYSNLNESFKPSEIEEQVHRAFDFAFEAHRAQRRKTTGEPFIIHPVSVALIVANEIGLGVLSVVAALLHDVAEDTKYTIEDIKERFGENVGDIVEGVTKITNVYNAKSNVQAETFKKMLLTIPHNPRMIFIKLADRIHNMRTMEGMPPSTIRIKTGENLYVYVPIAYQLGLFDIKQELEDSSFRFSQPQRFNEVQSLVQSERIVRDAVVKDFKKALMQMLVRSQLTCKIVTEPKSYYYVYKSLSAGIPIEDISYEAVRIVFQETDRKNNEQTVGEYYKLYSSIIYNFPERDGYKRDFVVKPKKNGFKALVFQINHEGHWIEVQILTEDDHMVSHKGYSIHKPDRVGLPVLKDTVVGLLDDDLTAEELISRYHSLATEEERSIRVFTPKGDIYSMPVDSTIIDFAYNVHTDVGNHCIGAFVGSRFVALDYKLKTADQVTIFTSASARPQQAWLHFVKTDRAISKISAYFHKSTTTANHVEDGKIIFHEYMFAHKFIPDIIIVKELIKYYHLLHGDELYSRIANHDLEMEEVHKIAVRIRKAIRLNKSESRMGSIGVNQLPQPPVDPEIFTSKKPLHIRKGMHFVAPSCCHPICGDDAVVFMDSDNILYIHRRDCVYANSRIAMDGKRTTNVEWDDNLAPMLAVIMIQGTDRQGIIRDVSVLIDSWRVNIQSFEIGARDNIFTGVIKIMVKNTQVLEQLSSQLSKISNIVSVKRPAPNSNNYDYLMST